MQPSLAPVQSGYHMGGRTVLTIVVTTYSAAWVDVNPARIEESMAYEPLAKRSLTFARKLSDATEASILVDMRSRVNLVMEEASSQLACWQNCWKITSNSTSITASTSLRWEDLRFPRRRRTELSPMRVTWTSVMRWPGCVGWGVTDSMISASMDSANAE